MSLMQGGVFAAIPLVADREKLILKRLGATPLRRWQLVGSNILVRLLVALIQTVIIVGVGTLLFGLETTGRWLAVAFFIVLGSLAFIALGYVIASFTKTEEAANGVTQVVQLPMLFLSGIFFPIATMGDFLQTVARLMPLTYLADALRQVMVDGIPFASLGVCVAVLAGLARRVFRDRRRASSAGSSQVAERCGGAPYQRSSWTISARSRPASAGRFGAVRSAASAGYPNDRMYSQWCDSG